MLAFVLHILKLYLLFDPWSSSDYNKQSMIFWLLVEEFVILKRDQFPVTDVHSNKISSRAIFPSQTKDVISSWNTSASGFMCRVCRIRTSRQNEFMCGPHSVIQTGEKGNEWASESEGRNPNYATLLYDVRPFDNSFKITLLTEHFEWRQIFLWIWQLFVETFRETMSFQYQSISNITIVNRMRNVSENHCTRY